MLGRAESDPHVDGVGDGELLAPLGVTGRGVQRRVVACLPLPLAMEVVRHDVEDVQVPGRRSSGFVGYDLKVLLRMRAYHKMCGSEGHLVKNENMVSIDIRKLVMNTDVELIYSRSCVAIYRRNNNGLCVKLFDMVVSL